MGKCQVVRGIACGKAENPAPRHWYNRLRDFISVRKCEGGMEMELIRSEKITVDAAGGKFSGFLAQPSTSAPKVLVYHAWWGLTPFFQEWARSEEHTSELQSPKD